MQQINKYTIHNIVKPSSLSCSRALSLPQMETPYPLMSHYPFLPAHNPWQTTNLFFVSTNLSILNISYKQNYTVYGLLCRLKFSLSIMFLRISMLLHISVLHSFLWLGNTLLSRYTTLCLSIHQLINFWVVYFFLTILNSTVTNIHV